MRTRDFEQNRHITVVVSPNQERVYGNFSLTYEVRPTGPDSSWLVCKADPASSTRWDRARWFLLAWGDLIMMRKQFLTLKYLAEKTARERAGTGAVAVDSKGGVA